MILAYRVVLRTICADLRTIFACAAYDFTVSHETNSLPGNKMYVVRLKKFSFQKTCAGDLLLLMMCRFQELTAHRRFLRATV
jgi:hypothetical protein